MSPHDIFSQLIYGSTAAASVEAAVRELLHKAESARIAWEAAGSPDSGPEHDAYADAAERFQAAVVDHVEGVRMMRELRPMALAYLKRMGAE